MAINHYIYASFAALLFSSCSSSLSEEDQSKLSSIAIVGTSTASDARQAVIGSKSSKVGMAIPIATGGGALPALLGMAINKAIVSSQNENFNAQYAGTIYTLKTHVPGNLNRQITQSTRKVFSADPFFGPRIKPRSTNRVKVKVTTFGLQRSDRSEGHTLLNANIMCDVILTDQAGDEYIAESIHAQSPNSLSVPALASSKSRTDALFAEALRDYETQLKELLDDQLKRK